MTSVENKECGHGNEENVKKISIFHLPIPCGKRGVCNM